MEWDWWILFYQNCLTEHLYHQNNQIEFVSRKHWIHAMHIFFLSRLKLFFNLARGGNNMSLPATRTLKKILQLLQNTKYVRQTHKRIDGIFDFLFEKKSFKWIRFKNWLHFSSLLWTEVAWTFWSIITTNNDITWPDWVHSVGKDERNSFS